MSPMEETPALAAPAMTDVGDEALLDFRTFFEEEHVELFRALWLVTRDRHEAEDVMQEAFLRIWERWARVARMSHPTGYLYRTAMNVLRSRARRARLGLGRAIGIAPVDDGMSAVEDRDALVYALAPLTRRQRAAIVLVDVLGLPSEEAARALGIRASTVRVLAARAREALRREVAESHD